MSLLRMKKLVFSVALMCTLFQEHSGAHTRSVSASPRGTHMLSLGQLATMVLKVCACACMGGGGVQRTLCRLG